MFLLTLNISEYIINEFRLDKKERRKEGKKEKGDEEGRQGGREEGREKFSSLSMYDI